MRLNFSEDKPALNSGFNKPLEKDFSFINYGLAPKASSETLETLSSTPSPIPQRFRVNVSHHDNCKNYSELTNSSTKHNSNEIIDVVKKDIPNDSSTHVVDSEKKHSLLNQNLDAVNAVDMESNSSSAEDTESKTLCEKTPFLHHIDSEDHNEFFYQELM